MRILFSFLLFTFYFASTAQIPSYVPTNGLVGWWPFNGNANDESGNGNNGTVNGATLTTDRNGNPNSSYSFNGGGNYISVPNSNTIGVQKNISISLWFLMDGGSCNPRLLETHENFSTCGGYSLRTVGTSNTSRTIDGGFGSCSYGIGFSGNFQVQSLSWQHLVMTIDGIIGVLKVYLNGNLVQTSSGNSIPTFSYNNNPLTIGNIEPSRCDWWGGKIDDIAIYNRALTTQEITQLYTGTITPSTPEDTTSNVGIGTTTPKRKLHVNDVMRLEPRNTAPANPAKGDIYFDGVLNKLRVYDGSVWQSCW